MARRQVRLIAVVAGSICLFACAGFVRPHAVAVNSTAPVPVNNRTEGYLRAWTTANLGPISKSWTANDSRRHFKKLLVTLQRDTQLELPILSLDITGGAPAASELIDKDFGNLTYVQLDQSAGDQQSGPGQEARVAIKIRAVPVTAADFADAVATYGNDLINKMPAGQWPGAGLVAGPLVGEILGSISREAKQYKNKEWSRTLDASVASQLALARGHAAWLLLPDEDDEVAPSRADEPYKRDPARTTLDLPRELLACNQNARQDGRLTHLCVKKNGRVAKYDDYAWVSIYFELLAEPASDLVPDVKCGELSQTAMVEAQIGELVKYKLSQTHREELDAYIQLLSAASAIKRHAAGPSQVLAFERWMAAGGRVDVQPTLASQVLVTSAPDRAGAQPVVLADQGKGTLAPRVPAVQTTTWSTINARRRALEQCVLSEIAQPDVKFRKEDAVRMFNAEHGENPLTPASIYGLIDTLDLVLADSGETDDRDVGFLTNRRRRLEVRLYKIEFGPNETQDSIDRKLRQYGRCGYCQAEGKKRLAQLPPAPLPKAPVPAASGVASAVEAVGLDPRPLVEFNKAAANLEFAIASKKSATEVSKARTEFRDASDKAEKLLIDDLKISPTASKQYLFGGIQ